MHPMWRKVQSPRHRVLRHCIFDASTLPEVRKHPHTASQLVREVDGKSLSENLGENGEKIINFHKIIN